MKSTMILIGLVIAALLCSGCSGPTQDEEFKVLISQVADDFSGQKEVIIKPYQGLTPDQLRQYKSAAISAQKTADSMTLSDKFGKARGIFVQGMNATISAVDTLEETGKLTSAQERITTESVNVYFISTQTKIGDALDIIGIKNDKGF
jgi:hypothetical protein